MANMVVSLEIPNVGTLAFPFTMESISFGATFQLASFRGMEIPAPRYDFDPISLEFALVVSSGAYPLSEPIVSSAGALLALCQKLVKACLPTREELIRQGAATLSIGTWFEAKGFPTHVQYEFKKPWELSGGAPMAANVTLEFKPFIWTYDEDDDAYRKIFRKEFDSFTSFPDPSR